MTLTNAAIRKLQDAPAPDLVTRPAIASLVEAYRKRLDDAAPHDEGGFARAMGRRAVAEHADSANAQHYELPARFFELCLGPRLKYSCCLYEGAETLEYAEVRALEETCAHADLHDGQDVLELGCGWGSLSLWMAERYPNSRITAVSNSASQRAHIEARAEAAGLTNLRVITQDMNDFHGVDGADGQSRTFDRIVSVEMFEHMANWRILLTRCRSWLRPDGRMFIHVFSHRDAPYRFDHTQSDDFIAQHFFTGGIMPSHGLIRHFSDLLAVEEDWTWPGENYRRTADDWLKNMDRNKSEVRDLMAQTYGDDAALWTRRWRRFFMATAGLFGDDEGRTWGVSHYRLKPV
ncbi:SAM-dependent methyltransferase [Brevundimonas lutea]|uniref:SAM-dependent methyltransferase n=1 Tax=Brevundimonas lutea TaxID=2293980 RepID=UPI000F0143EC|nr:cyclopropane-fatty-acyl-phospholipid synthase family protein [Brevundimonas lutea]